MTDMTAPSSVSRTVRRATVAWLVLAGSVIGGFGTASAATSCGEYSFGFEGTRLLNDGISNTAGPFAIDLPAGTYTVVLESSDAHSEHPGQVDQIAEQWYFTLDSGYVSPVSSDIPDDMDYMDDKFADQTIEASTTITLHHLGEGSINSVNPLCVGFTHPAMPTEEPQVPDVVVAGPQIPPREIVDPVDEPTPPVVVVDAPAPVIEPEVKGEVVEVAAPVEAQLALTGPSRALTLSVLAAALMLIGSSLSIAGESLDRRPKVG